MKLDRTKNAKRNIVFGMAEKMLNILIQLVARTIVLYVLGVEYLGLNALFASILGVLSLAELGFGNAVSYSLYKPIAEDDTETICALMQFYKTCYRIIGIVILAIGLVLLPWLPILVKGDVPPDIDIYALYFINLIGTCVSYFMFAYKGVLLSAHQRQDVVNRIGMFISFGKNTLEIMLLLLFRNYYLYVLLIPMANVASGFATSYVVDRMYPMYRAKGHLQMELRKSIINKVKALFCYRVGNVVVNSVDTLVISAFLGLTLLGKYQNYYYIITALFGFFSLFYNSIGAGIGNVMEMDGRDKTYELFQTILLIQAILVSWCTVCLLCIFQPFMRLWAGEHNMLSNGYVICFAVYFFQWKIQDIVYIFKDAGGMWEYDALRPLITSAINLTLNLISVQFLGLYGILLSTIISSAIVDMPWTSRVLFQRYFQRPTSEYIKQLFVYLGITLCMSIPTWLICNAAQGSPLTILLKCVGICIVVPTGIGYVLFRKMPGYNNVAQIIRGIIRR